MRILYIDCAAGVSGDMLCKAMRDLGFPAGTSPKLPSRGSLPYRARELFQLIRSCRLRQPLQSMILRVFRKIFEAEAKAHGVPWHSVRLHQLKGRDTLLSIAGFCAALLYFKVERVYCSPVPLGWKHEDHHGKVRHIPGPATRHLLAGLSIKERSVPFEWTTPTGAALLSTFVKRGPVPPLKILKIGQARGTRKPPLGPAALQLLLADSL